MPDSSPLPPPEAGGPGRAANRSLSVTDQIRDAILDGTVSAGERINEVRFSKTLEVSRTPVRAALQALAGEGLLDYAPNRGFTVREFRSRPSSMLMKFAHRWKAWPHASPPNVD
jgi:GntR family transcriptional regulator of vanillate catabolism